MNMKEKEVMSCKYLNDDRFMKSPSIYVMLDTIMAASDHSLLPFIQYTLMIVSAYFLTQFSKQDVTEFVDAECGHFKDVSIVVFFLIKLLSCYSLSLSLSLYYLQNHLTYYVSILRLRYWMSLINGRNVNRIT